MCYSFNHQFRFNTAHQYNSSFGKDRSRFNDRLKQNLITAKQKIDETDIAFMSGSFIEFDFSDFNENDFVYCDPPYHNSTGNYNDGKRGFEGWNAEHEGALRNLLDKLNGQDVRWALSNNLTCNTTLEDWARDRNYIVIDIQSDYDNCNYQKKKKGKDREVLITNI